MNRLETKWNEVVRFYLRAFGRNVLWILVGIVLKKYSCV